MTCGVNYLGGAELQLLRLLPILEPEQHALRVVILAPSGGELATSLERLGYHVDVLTMGRARHLGATLSAVRGLARFARDVDLLHANDVRAATWCQLAAMLARRPWVWHVRDLLRGAHRYEHAARLFRPTRLVTNSRAVKRRLLEFGSWDASRIDVALNGIDSAALRAQADRQVWRAEMALAEEELAVGVVGRLVPWKGQEDFIRAAALLSARVPNVRFFVVGGVVTDRHTAEQLGDERERLERLSRELGLAERMTFTGARGDIPSVMAGLDVLVLTSHAEPFGNVLLEAMSLGTPVIATAAGGAEEVVEPGKTGLLVPPRDPAALACALQTLLLDPPMLRAFGAAGRERVASHFTLERQAREVLATWERVASGRR